MVSGVPSSASPGDWRSDVPTGNFKDGRFGQGDRQGCMSSCRTVDSEIYVSIPISLASRHFRIEVEKLLPRHKRPCNWSNPLPCHPTSSHGWWLQKAGRAPSSSGSRTKAAAGRIAKTPEPGRINSGLMPEPGKHGMRHHLGYTADHPPSWFAETRYLGPIFYPWLCRRGQIGRAHV